MPLMKDQRIAWLETQLERVVEGTFAQLFGKRVHAHDLILQLSRAMEDGLEPDPRGSLRSIAPDYYAIHLNPRVCQQLLQNQPNISAYLAEYLTEVAGQSGYRLITQPTVELIPNNEVSPSVLLVRTRHVRKKHSTTAVMQRVDINPQQEKPHNPQILLHGKTPIPLQTDVINIGRSRDNHIVVDDRSVSRYHLQLRLRFGRYTLFDTQSQGGTFVNDVRVKEHNLQTGDVIQIGNTRLVYMDDQPPHDGQTQSSEPILPDSVE